MKRGERGQAIVLVAIMIVVLIGMSALAIDGSRAYMLRRDLQAAVDAAALAAGDTLQWTSSYPQAEQAASTSFGMRPPPVRRAVLLSGVRGAGLESSDRHLHLLGRLEAGRSRLNARAPRRPVLAHGIAIVNAPARPSPDQCIVADPGGELVRAGGQPPVFADDRRYQ